MNITQAHAKCARKGGQLADATNTATADFLMSMYTSYRNEYDGNENALAAYGNDCMVFRASGAAVSSPCAGEAMPICMTDLM